MVSRIIKKTPTRSMPDCRNHRRRTIHRKKSPAKDVPSAIMSSINRTIFTCKRSLVKFLAKFMCIGTPSGKRYKGYTILKSGNLDQKQYQEQQQQQQEQEQQQQQQRESIRRALFSNERMLLPPLISPNKKTVFLDLDETLVHSKADPPPHVFDFIVRPKIEGEYMTFYVLKRPGVDEFLEALGAKYEVAVFTAGLKEYASLVLDRLDRKGVISHRLYRNSCRQVHGRYVKDLSNVGRDLKRVVIVDDNPNSYAFQPENAIPIKPFINDLRDAELQKLGMFFDGCDCYEDMRDAVNQYVSEGDIMVQVKL